MTYSKYGKGWYNESRRHALAARGVKTGRKTASLGFGLGKRFTNYAKYSAGDTVAGQIIPGNKVRADITGNIIKLDKEEMKKLSVGDRVTLTFGGPDRIMDVEKEEMNYNKEGTQFGILQPSGKVTKTMIINVGKVKSNDPLAYSYGYFQAKSGQPMSKDKNLAPEYIRGYKDAKAGKKIDYAKKKKLNYFNIRTSSPMKADKLHDILTKNGIDSYIYDWGNNKYVTVNNKDRNKVKKLLKINYAYTPGDLPNIVTQGLGTAGASAVEWVPAIVAVGATKHIVKQVKSMTKKKKKKRGR